MAATNEKWERDVCAIREGTRLYLTNDFRAAEDLFKKHMGDSEVNFEAASKTTTGEDVEEDSELSTVGDVVEARDIRGAFALQFAIIGLMRGVASLANDRMELRLEARGLSWTSAPPSPDSMPCTPLSQNLDAYVRSPQNSMNASRGCGQRTV